MLGKAYTCSDCGSQVSSTELAKTTKAERAALRNGTYLCADCRRSRQLVDA